MPGFSRVLTSRLTPAQILTLKTFRQGWPLLLVSQVANALSTVLESSTLGVIFIAITLISQPDGLTNTANPPFLKWLPGFNDWLRSTPIEQSFILILGLAVSLQVLLSTATYISRVSIQVLSADLRKAVVQRIYDQILSFSFGHVSGYKVGDLIDNVESAHFAIREELISLNNLVSNCCMILAYAFILLSISPTLSLVSLGMVGVLLVTQKQILPRIRQNAEVIKDSQVSIQSLMTESFQAMRLLHSFGNLSWFQRRLGHELSREAHLSKRMALITNVIGPISEILPILCIAVIAGVGFVLLNHRTSGALPSLATYILALQRLAQRVRAVMADQSYLAENHGRIRRLNVILSPDGKQFASSGHRVFRSPLDQIVLRHLSLTYPDSREPALKHLDLTIPARTSLALVGSSGAGKSTIVDLILRLYEPSQGEILINSQPLQELDTFSWRQAIGVVSQDPILLNASLAENISFGCQQTSEDAIRLAAAQAQALTFIEDLPEGFNTIVGERGYRLSGGQRQRIALARALIRRPQLLILDEATSALDSESESLIQQAIEGLNGELTVLIIAHRLSTIRNADRIAVLDKGQLKEIGTHQELLTRNGRYSQLWAIQQEPLHYRTA